MDFSLGAGGKGTNFGVVMKCSRSLVVLCLVLLLVLLATGVTLARSGTLVGTTIVRKVRAQCLPHSRSPWATPGTVRAEITGSQMATNGAQAGSYGLRSAASTPQNPCKMAEGVGFEPTNDLRRCRFSRPVR
jgi:hypothetical protein